MLSSQNIDIIRHIDPESTHAIRSHVLHPHDDITVICMVGSPRENIVSVLEDHLLESISSTGWNHGDEEADFAYITEKYNHFQRNLAATDIRDMSALFAIIFENEMMISVIGSMCAVLREKNGDLNTIAENQEEDTEFTSVSSGKIPTGAQFFLSSQPLSSFLSDDFFDECTELSHDSFTETLEGILKRETHETIHIIRITGPKIPEKTSRPFFQSSQKVSKQIDIARGFLENARESIRYNRRIERVFDEIRLFISKKNTHILILFLLVGATLFFGLIYVLVSALFHVSNNPSVDTKNQIIQAKTLIEESQKLTSNSEAFNNNIRQAEDILFKIRDKQEYMKDTQQLLQRIEAMKKEMYDIQTVDLTKHTSIVPFDSTQFSPLGVFEFNKKLNLIGKDSAILGYIQGNSLPTPSTYPPGEEVTDFDMTDDGTFYFLTKNNRILSTKRNEVTYANVTGQDSWENASGIQTFNNNIYLTNNSGGQIYKHKPGTNGFSQKIEVLPSTLSGILDIGIDGGFYILTDEPKIYRMISKDNGSPSGIILNKIPGEYTAGKNGDVQIVVRSNLNLIYLLSGNRIWIFEPDSKRFQDVRSWTYLAQLEISTAEEIRTISVPRDGLIYITTNLGVYSVPFEFVDKNIILKN
ncbi:MAG: hypothetical protein PHY14_03530 [Candidatus Gracilibacteria bacterium]|nr:hypothetical protein [Candidatus Gracilibacteria bacterium]